MLRMVARERATVRATSITSFLSSATSAASMATSVPEPMAIPTSAWASAGASLIPSPTMAVILPWRWSFATSAALCSGSTSARTVSIPISAAMARATPQLSPVIMATSMPSWRSSATAAFDVSRTTSAVVTRPTRRPSRAT